MLNEDSSYLGQEEFYLRDIRKIGFDDVLTWFCLFAFQVGMEQI